MKCNVQPLSRNNNGKCYCLQKLYINTNISHLFQARSSPARPIVSQQSVIVHASSAQPLIRASSVASPSKQPEQRKETSQESEVQSEKLAEPQQQVTQPTGPSEDPSVVPMEVGETSRSEKPATENQPQDGSGNQSSNQASTYVHDHM